jgi:hypothetical protein
MKMNFLVILCVSASLREFHSILDFMNAPAEPQGR